MTVAAIQSAVYAALAAHAALATQVGARVYPDEAPQGTVSPYVVWQEISLVAQGNDLGGSVETGGLSQYRVQITSWAKGSDRGATKAREVDGNVKLAMIAATGFKSLLVDSRALPYESETKFHGVQSDFSVWLRT